MSLENITVVDFKLQFSRNFPYLPVWEAGKAYAEGDIVYFEGKFFVSLVNENTADTTDEEKWKLTTEVSYNEFVSDEDLERAKSEAIVNFNKALVSNCEACRVAFLYLWAFYLSYDLTLANGGASGSVNYPTTSVSVGSVSESYYVPKAYMEDPILGFYARNGFGLKYLNLVYANTIGNVSVVAGWSLP